MTCEIPAIDVMETDSSVIEGLPHLFWLRSLTPLGRLPGALLSPTRGARVGPVRHIVVGCPRPNGLQTGGRPRGVGGRHHRDPRAARGELHPTAARRIVTPLTSFPSRTSPHPGNPDGKPAQGEGDRHRHVTRSNWTARPKEAQGYTLGRIEEPRPEGRGSDLFRGSSHPRCLTPDFAGRAQTSKPPNSIAAISASVNPGSRARSTWVAEDSASSNVGPASTSRHASAAAPLSEALPA